MFFSPVYIGCVADCVGACGHAVEAYSDGSQEGLPMPLAKPILDRVSIQTVKIAGLPKDSWPPSTPIRQS